MVFCSVVTEVVFGIGAMSSLVSNCHFYRTTPLPYLFNICILHILSIVMGKYVFMKCYTIDNYKWKRNGTKS